MGSSEKMAAFIENSVGRPTGLRSDKVSDQRLAALFDPQSFVCLDSTVTSRPFSELFDRPSVEGDGVVTGYGTIHGRLVFAASQDPTVYGGSMGRVHAMKIAKAIEMAIDANAPFVALLESGGARIEEGVLALEGLGAVLSALSEAKGVIPILSAIFGPCPGGLAIAAAKSDFLFMIQKKSGLYINSPALSFLADIVPIPAEKIGTAEMHTKTGLASFVAPDEESCLRKMRDVLDFIPVVSGEDMSVIRQTDVSDDPNRISDVLNQMAAESDSTPLRVGAVIAEIADNNSFLEISQDYGKDMVIAFGKLDGVTVGFVGNDALRMTPEGVRKTAKFVSFCDAFMIPLITFTNSEGVVIGSQTETTTILQDIAALVDAFASSSVPRIAVLMGKAIGTAYLCMNSKMLGADMVYAWPSAEVSVMSADAASHILYRDQIAGSKNPITARAKIVDDYRNQIADVSVAASLGQVDELILPSATRPRIISALDILLCSYPMTER